jgi:hypothetical protein
VEGSVAGKQPKKPLHLRVNELGRSPLWDAAFSGDLRTVQRYLDAGADPNIGDFERMTPLYIAAYYAHLEAVKLLLEHDADPNLVDCNGVPPLQPVTHQAGLVSGTDQHLAFVDLLLRHGADPDHKNKWGATPRDFAKHGSQELRALFAGVKPSHKAPGPGRRAPTPGEVSGTRDETYFWTIHTRLWDELVPPSGPAKTVQGEIIRIVGKLTREAYTNGNVNWGPSCTVMWKFVARTLNDPQTFTDTERARIKEWVKVIIRDRHRPDVSGDGSPYYLVAEKAVAWVLAHPNPIPYIPDPRVKM